MLTDVVVVLGLLLLCSFRDPKLSKETSFSPLLLPQLYWQMSVYIIDILLDLLVQSQIQTVRVLDQVVCLHMWMGWI